MSHKKAYLALEDGLVFEGLAFGAEGETYGEAVFNTSLTGYQEILTDPSYARQIVTMTYPHIGNYGITKEDEESGKPWVAGFVVRELSPVVSNFRSQKSLDQYLKENNIIGIQEIDTRRLAKHLRDHGAKKAIISTVDSDHASLVEKAKASPSIEGADLVQEVTCEKPYSFHETLPKGFEWGNAGERKTRYKVVAIDCGIKKNILRKFVQHGLDVDIVPATTSAADILAKNPDGVFISNGPGDPAAVTYVIESAKDLIGKVPLFGICLGHQILSLALGGTTSKLKFGHRGGNHPVIDLKTERVEITSQNHGFVVDIDSLGEDVELTHKDLTDDALEGIAHKKYPLFSVQYHPENSPGPHDSDYLYTSFYKLIEAHKGVKA